MNISNVILLAVILMIISGCLFLLVWFSPKKRKMRKIIKRKKREDQNKRLALQEELQEKYKEKNFFFIISEQGNYIADDKNEAMPEFINSKLYINFHLINNYCLFIVPVIIKDINFLDSHTEPTLILELFCSTYKGAIIKMEKDFAVAYCQALGEIKLYKEEISEEDNIKINAHYHNKKEIKLKITEENNPYIEKIKISVA